MAAFFSEVLDEFLTSVFLEGVRRKFHYGEIQKAEFQAVAEEMLPLMRGEAFWERKEFSVQNTYGTEMPDRAEEKVVMSLGNGVDDLQESYSKKGMLSQSYMLEALASELLMRGYHAYNRYISENTDWHVARYHFPGSEESFPLEMLPQLLKGFAQRITCNAAFCLLPKKSVIFVSELTKNEKIHCRGICIGCDNLSCPNRVADNDPVKRRMDELADMPLTYGYHRILGNIRQ